MKVTVKDCLQLDVFRQCVVVAGEESLDNRVKTVSVMDASTAEEAARRGGKRDEMVLTTFAGIKKTLTLRKKSYVSSRKTE